MNNNKERTLHLIDVENLIGSPNPTPDCVRWYHLAYQALHVAPTDQVIVACSHHAAPNVFWEWSQGCHRWRSGENGADLALLKVITQERISERFGCVALASGDGIFTKAVAGLGKQGVNVTVVSRPESLSRSLQMVAKQVSLFPYPPTNLDMIGTPL
ncbi:MAG: NYN domain-containing protein [bacterium]|nr:NYN domain-containing protein [bacterium]MCY4256904.1 NYN domain-containing protein [bacterium]